MIARIALGSAAGVLLFLFLGYIWMIFGADPNNDPLISI